MTHQINRRTALAAVAAVPASAVVTPFALSSSDEDAALMKLWNEWVEQSARFDKAIDAQGDAEGKMFEASSPYWDFVGIGTSGDATGPFYATFASASHGDNQIKTVPLKAKSLKEAQSEAYVVTDKLRAQTKREKETAAQRYGVPAATRAADREGKKRFKLEEQIAKTPAEGVTGLLVKVALLTSDTNAGFVCEQELVQSIYDAAVKVAGGVDLLAQIKA